MTDIIDQAGENEALHLAISMRRHEERRRLERERAADRLLAAAVARHKRPRPAGPDLCIDCDAPIPAARRRALPEADRCVDCQDAIDPQRLARVPNAARCVPCQTDAERAGR